MSEYNPLEVLLGYGIPGLVKLYSLSAPNPEELAEDIRKSVLGSIASIVNSETTIYNPSGCSEDEKTNDVKANLERQREAVSAVRDATTEELVGYIEELGIDPTIDSEALRAEHATGIKQIEEDIFVGMQNQIGALIPPRKSYLDE